MLRTYHLKKNRFVQVSTLIDVILAIQPFNGCDYFQNVEVGKSYYISSPEPNRKVCRWTAQAPERHNLVLECDVVYIPLVRLQFFFFYIFVCLLLIHCFLRLPSLYWYHGFYSKVDFIFRANVLC